MCSACRRQTRRRLVAIVLLAASVFLGACEREERAYDDDPAGQEGREKIVQTSLSPGTAGAVTAGSPLAEEYLNNAYHVSQGKRLFAWFNCTGCHGNGGGGSGPALMDDAWIYGGRIENIVQTIREGRPNGMPSFRGRIPESQIWELAAYVKSLSGDLSKDVSPGRNDDLMPHPSENRLQQAEPPGGEIPSSVETTQ